MPTTRQQIRRVLLLTLALNLAVAAGKIALGALTGALAITADGFHSLTDSAGNVAGLLANGLAARPPDEEHPYGHRRFESLAALLIGGLLLLTAWEMLQGLLARLREQTMPEIPPLTFAVLLVTLLVNVFVSRYQLREGQRLHSEVLQADAKHTRADVLVTSSVIFSTAILSITNWLWVDVLAAGVVVLLIIRAAWDIVRQTGRVLVDTAPYPSEHLRGLLRDLPLNADLLRVRSRGPLDAAYIDVDVQVPPEMTAEHSDHISDAIRSKLETALGGIAEIDVHFLPDRAAERDVVLLARACADALGLSTHEVQISHDDEGPLLEMHVEVPPGQTLAQAHEQVSTLEAQVLHALPEVGRVVTHIEPARQSTSPPDDAALRGHSQNCLQQAQTLLSEHFPGVGWHHLSARPQPEGIALNLHATLPPHISVEAAHGLAEEAETLLRASIPQLMRVTIHTEPYDHD